MSSYIPKPQQHTDSGHSNIRFSSNKNICLSLDYIEIWKLWPHLCDAMHYIYNTYICNIYSTIVYNIFKYNERPEGRNISNGLMIIEEKTDRNFLNDE